VIERLEVVAGPGTVIRYGAVAGWAAPSASPALISFLAQSARNLSGSARGGRQMADHIAGVLQERDPEPHVAFVVVGPDSLGWASLLHGPVQAWDGQRWLAPSPSPGWLQAIITPQPSVMVNTAGSPLPVVAPDSMWDLEAGVVPGSGFVLFPSAIRQAESGLGSVSVRPSSAAPGETFENAETAALESSPPTEVLETPELEMWPEGDPDPTHSSSIAGDDPETLVLETPAEIPPPEPPEAPEPLEPPRPPGPPGSIDLRRPPATDPRPPLPAAGGPDRSVPGAPVVGGLLCERQHLNRPGMRTCARCGAPVRADVTYTVSGTRPPLGCLVGDDGIIWRLDSSYLAGSNPGGDPTVRGGLARPLALEGAELAAAHAEIRLAGWDVEVLDRSSPAGTFIFEPGAREWMRLRPYEPRALRPGTHVAFGQRVVTFITPWIVPADTAATGS
jgi:hypothetical protein